MTDPHMHAETLLAHAGGGGVDPATGGVVPAIQPATTYARGSNYELMNPDNLYGRDDNGLYRQVEALLARLENAAECRLFATGMAALTAVVRTVPPRGSIVVQSGIYWGTTAWLRKHCKRSEITLVEIDATDSRRLDETVTTVAPDLVLLEVPSNPWLSIADIAAAAAATHRAGAILAVDATAATPLLMKPLDLGADLVIHSATKALNGHSDVLGGVVSAKDPDSAAWALIREERHDAGAIMGPFETYLLLRGMRTLAVRLERMCANAQMIADRLSAHPAVERVLYPGLASHPGHDLAARQMSGGFGYLMSFIVRGGAAEALAVAGGLDLVIRATSLGGTESLIEHRHTLEGEITGVSPGLLRLSVGIERADDIIADLTQALDGAHKRAAR